MNVVLRKKICALIAAEREKYCWPHHFSWTGHVPVTGRYVCWMCLLDLTPLVKSLTGSSEGEEYNQRTRELLRQTFAVVGRDTDGTLICEDGSGERYNCGETLEQYGEGNLRPEERQALGLEPIQSS